MQLASRIIGLKDALHIQIPTQWLSLYFLMRFHSI